MSNGVSEMGVASHLRDKTRREEKQAHLSTHSVEDIAQHNNK
jgi:hypothetical protein